MSEDERAFVINSLETSHVGALEQELRRQAEDFDPASVAGR